MEHTLLTVNDFQSRRDNLFKQMPDNSIAFIAAENEVTRSNDTEYPFCQNKHFYYLTGFNEPDAIVVLVKSSSCQSILFSREKDPLQEIWHGRRIGQLQAKSVYGFDDCYTLAELDELILPLLNGCKEVWYPFQSNVLNSKVSNWCQQLKLQSRTGMLAPNCLVDCDEHIAKLRLIKSENELKIMRQANTISGQAHQRAMKSSRAGKFEYQLEADILHEFATHGARFPAYNSIVAGGDNGNILHYTANDQALRDGELLLIDAGCELANYAADITRTFPVNGKFNDTQKALYQLVLNVQNHVISMIKPDMTFAKLNQICCEQLTIGLHELGILKGELVDLVADKACKKYFIHGLGHWLGLDVHDVGDYQSNENREQLCPFSPGMVMTIEPGLYMPSDDLDIDAKWRGIAIRIEDNIVVTATGYENITVNVPKEVNDIEALMAN